MNDYRTNSTSEQKATSTDTFRRAHIISLNFKCLVRMEGSRLWEVLGGKENEHLLSTVYVLRAFQRLSNNFQRPQGGAVIVFA